MTKSNAHLIYMTGLSMDKKRLNYITENINFDKDYVYWLGQVLKSLRKALSGKSKKIRKVRRSADDYSEAGLYANSHFDIKNAFTFDDVIDGFASNVPFFGKFTVSVLKLALNQFEDVKNYDELIKANKDIITQLDKLVIGYLDKTHNHYIPGDFFSLYISHQSDGIGIMPLSKIATRKQFKVHHSYCDWDYFDNKYIDHVIIKVRRDKLRTDSVDEITNMYNSVYASSLYDTVLSRILNEVRVSDKESKYVNNSIFGLLKENTRYNIDDILSSLSERNFFGISLLSSVLFAIKEDCEQGNLNVHIAEGSTDGHNFLSELLTMSVDPNYFTFNNEADSDISARIYFSDGEKLQKKEKDYDNNFIYNKIQDELFNDEFFLSSNNLNRLQEEEKKHKINELVNTVNLHNTETADFHYICNPSGYENTSFLVQSDYIYFKIPIKIVVSLPIDKRQRGNHELLIPHCLNNTDKDKIDLITVGGAEHNRALAHLINKYRWQYKDKRLFGFMDNVFDLNHKCSVLDNNSQKNGTEKISNTRNFFMGINQPVSGWNSIFNSREDDDDGNSENRDVKLLSFRLHSGTQKFNVLSIYGFSAVASVLGVNLIVAEINNKKTGEIKANKSLFGGGFSSILGDDSSDTGSASTVFFYKNLKQVLDIAFRNKKHSLLKNLYLDISSLTLEQKKLVKNTLYDNTYGNDVSILNILKKEDHKYKIIIDNKCGELDCGIFDAEKIRIDVKDVVKKSFNDKCNLYEFNNNVRNYSKTFFTKRNMLICRVWPGVDLK